MDQPEIDAGGEWFLNAFYELNTGRLVTDSGANPISWRDIVDFAGLHCLEPDVYQIFRVVIRDLDAAYLADWAAEQERKARQQRKSKKPE